MKSPFSPLYLAGFILLIAFLVAFVQVGALTIAFEKLGLSQHSAILLLFSSLFGSAINLPLFSVRAEAASLEQVPERLRGIAFGFLSTSNGLVALPAPWIGAMLWKGVAPVAPFWVTTAAMLLVVPPVLAKFKLPSAPSPAAADQEPSGEQD